MHPALDVSEHEMQLMPFEGLPPKYLALRNVQYKWEVTLTIPVSSCLAISYFTLGMEKKVLPLLKKGILPSAVGVGGYLPEESTG